MFCIARLDYHIAIHTKLHYFIGEYIYFKIKSSNKMFELVSVTMNAYVFVQLKLCSDIYLEMKLLLNHKIKIFRGTYSQMNIK